MKSIFPAFAGTRDDGADGDPRDSFDAAETGRAYLGTAGPQDGAENPADGPTPEKTAMDTFPGPGSLSVLRLTDISHRSGRFTLDSIAVTVQPDIAGLFR